MSTECFFSLSILFSNATNMFMTLQYIYCLWFLIFRKAIKFYMYDICVNPRRLDSWAGLALARMYQLEQKLNSVSSAVQGERWHSLYSFIFQLSWNDLDFFVFDIYFPVNYSLFTDWSEVGCVTPEAVPCSTAMLWAGCGYRGCLRQAVDGVWVFVLPTPCPLLQTAQLPPGSL